MSRSERQGSQSPTPRLTVDAYELERATKAIQILAGLDFPNISTSRGSPSDEGQSCLSMVYTCMGIVIL